VDTAHNRCVWQSRWGNAGFEGACLSSQRGRYPRRVCDVQQEPTIENDPLQALLIRIAFIASHLVDDWTETKFRAFRAKYHVSLEDIIEWLGSCSCVLILDEMNRADGKIKKQCREGSEFMGFLRSSFLAPKGRAFVFSSHSVTTVNEFDLYLGAAACRRPVLVASLPKVTSYQVTNDALDKDLTIQQRLYLGLVPALIHTTRSSQNNGSRRRVQGGECSKVVPFFHSWRPKFD